MKLFIAVIFLILVQDIFSQEIENSLNNSINQNFNRADSTIEIQISSLVRNNRFDKALNSGIRWGFNSTLISGIIAIPLLGSSEGYAEIALPILIGGVGVISGIIYGLFSDISSRYNSGKYSYGIKTNFGATLTSKSQRYNGVFGFIFRNPNNNGLNPDNYYLYLGYEDTDGIVEGGNHPSLNAIKYGVEFTKVGYQNTINLMYGVGAGYLTGNFFNSKYNSFDDIISNDVTYEEKGVSSLYLDLILGVNLNFTKSFHLSLEYKYGVFGIYDEREISEYFSPAIKHTLSFSIYSFIY